MDSKHLPLVFICASSLFISNPVFSQPTSANPGARESSSLAGGLAGLGAASTQNGGVIKKDAPPIAPINVDGAKMNDFLVYDNSCKTGNSEACLAAGKIMMAEKPPQEIFNLSSTTRVNRAIRLYEAAISTGNNLEAMELVYDLYYDKNIIDRNIHSYTDKDRARELMDIMLAKDYPGGQIRQARDYIEDPEYILSISKKKEACATARIISKRGDITASTKLIADDMLAGNVCMVYNK